MKQTSKLKFSDKMTLFNRHAATHIVHSQYNFQSYLCHSQDLDLREHRSKHLT